MNLVERFTSLAILAFMLVYTWLAFDYTLLPFERTQPFKPNSLPIGLSIIGVAFALISVFFCFRQPIGKVSMPKGETLYRLRQLIYIIIVMLIYSASLRSVGFIGATTLFLTISAAILGERKWLRLVLISIFFATVIWFLVDYVLGIYLVPLPSFLLI